MEREKIQIVQQTWLHVLPIAEVAADLFYQRLFEIDPTVKPLFKNTDLAAQKGKLLQMLSDAIASLNTPATVLRNLEVLGRRHAAYGVQPSHYEAVGEALLWTLEKGLADRWSHEAREAWAAVYALIARQMLNGANSTTVADDRLRA